MTAINQNLAVPAGETLVFSLPVKSGGADVPLAGAQIEWWLGRRVDSKGADVLLKKTVGAGIVVDGSTATVTISASETRALKPGFYFHQTKILFAGGVEKVPTTGSFEVTPTMS